jgi:wyosine [tRNA(Phe)-imidazoG37] synthetase (radical SAM superfamily)
MNLNTLKYFIDRVRRYSGRLLNRGQRDSSGSLNTNQDLQGRFCRNPFVQLDVYEQGKLHSCCSSWLPTPIGNLRKMTVAQAWNSPASQMIRESIFDGSFRYCHQKVCPMIQQGTLPTLEEARKEIHLREIIDKRQTRLDVLPRFINLCNDESCNLSCPSCRVARINYPHGKEYEKRLHLQDKLTQELFSQPTDHPFIVNVTGSGDPFASAIFREFLFNLQGDDFPNLQINLQTNGVLLTPKNWQKMHKIHNRIATILISFDAATEETYNITRRGGNWEWLQENTKRLGELRRTGELNFLRLDFVVQKANFREMPQFIEIAKTLNADRAQFSMVLDWGTWSLSDYEKQCIWKQDHPEFNEFISVLENPVFDDPLVALGNLTEYRQLAKSRLKEAV